ncbi:MAG: bifunctional 3,4-dihydroxy-2-butanone-4-phosphate synthase/GTP cyclohydrolase II [Bacteroidales bacterium]|jgi:3,4-dihydroxy 2-butanone 4-phosphate synthase/GTP cyclohydrolase II|nr:bifunctional 3,4-dihydroxy-2-butanone-4-phosphate synthase/GTP cyclohydrolase II [Bacteroidales bacterium]MDI9575359.1 bifunctional 3,4-dihydroxy-2-butanone-4-phosphate synthase/GTP cyclohydrolase II [Bacteroidota bacterium]MDY0400092.1 bifunctional 3,4-dihydroxy-2-butanone-4-phosphate synthase/GTP cyclohydrolase II [Bacteroidales bacterium]HHW59769.1 bifunctional 3,4-dihydroxy-2-butanone-4-phosphate synthase/GTP cyclohydrolase II [Bacteroidales bacterium]
MDNIIYDIPDILDDIRLGKLIIVVDDEDRENEGDFILAAEKITPEIVNFMSKHGRGLICTPISQEVANKFNLPLMVEHNTATHNTAFTVSIDLLGYGNTTGISAADRARTIYWLTRDNAKPEDFGRPGHIFPLIAKPGGVLQRAGHTEASVDLCRLAGLKPIAVLVEILNDDGTMARLPQLIEIAKKFDIKITSVKRLIQYRLKHESLIKQVEEVFLPTEYGNFQLKAFLQITNNLPHLALVKGKWEADESILVRVHSSCVTGDIFGSYKCDCGPQLHRAMQMIENEGKGVIVYMNQEGRGIGLLNKLKAYHLQEEGLDTVDANLALGFKDDERDYGIGAQILRALGAKKIRLITNNPIKKIALEGYGLEIVETIPLEIEPNPYNRFYLQTKATKMGHNISILDNKIENK